MKYGGQTNALLFAIGTLKDAIHSYGVKSNRRGGDRGTRSRDAQVNDHGREDGINFPLDPLHGITLKSLLDHSSISLHFRPKAPKGRMEINPRRPYAKAYATYGCYMPPKQNVAKES
jgi:hypothetical protein